MEFVISTDLEKSLPAVIDFNFEELRAELAEGLTRYNALVVTLDSIKAGKEDRAKLNKLKAAIEDRRKEVKRLCLAPYEAFEFKCRTLTGMIDEAAGSIDSQVKAFEASEKAEKRGALEAAYTECIGDLSGLLPFERFFSSKWLNKGVTLDAAKAELEAAISKAGNDIKIIRAMRLECEDQMVTAYLDTLDMSAALAEKGRFEARQEQLARMKEAEAVVHDAGAPGFDFRDEKSGEVVRFGGASECAVSQEKTKTVKVIFYDTTAAFRAEMKVLAQKYCIKYGGIQ